MPLTSGFPLNPVLLRQLDTVGDGTGTKNIIQNYLGNPTVIRYEPAENQFALIHDFSVQYSDAGSFQQDVYASLPGPLAVGVSINLYDRSGNVIYSITDNTNVTRNDEWYRLGYDFVYNNWAGSNENTLVASLNADNFGSPLPVDGSAGQYIGVSVADDFTSLVSQTFTVKGIFK